MGKSRRRIGNRADTLAADKRRERIESVVKLYLSGKSTLDIARIKGVNRDAVYQDIKTARKIWAKRNDRAAETLIAEEVAKIDRIEAELWDEWERSKNKIQEHYREKDEGGVTVKKTVRIKGRTAEASYLALALKCVDARCRLLKIGEYATRETGELVGMLVEVVVENASEVEAMMNYRDYEKLTAPSAN